MTFRYFELVGGITILKKTSFDCWNEINHWSWVYERKLVGSLSTRQLWQLRLNAERMV